MRWASERSKSQIPVKFLAGFIRIVCREGSIKRLALLLVALLFGGIVGRAGSREEQDCGADAL